ncbi:MAG: ATP-binding protein [Thermoplasmata archaeon]|nr:MAG: ATP-binding protein [Thermoplasmata archaeon]
MVREEIFGRDESLVAKAGKRGCCYLGKIVSYPAGRYEEGGAIYFDLTSPHCMLIVGKRGTGKSYTLGVIAEGFGMLDEEIRKRISVVIIDTMSVFHSLKSPNSNTSEITRLGDFQGLKPRDFTDYVGVFLPKLTIENLKAQGIEIAFDYVLQLSLQDISVHDWLILLNLQPTEPAGALLVRVMERLAKQERNFGYEEIYEMMETERAEEHVKSSLMNLIRMIEELKVFDRDGTDFSAIIKGGQLSVLDISYLGRVGGFDVRNLIVGVLARKLLSQRTLYTTLEMQAEANLLDRGIMQGMAGENPLVYMFIDEAHLFLPQHHKTLASDVLIDWIKLGRHPGLSLVLATQEPSALHETAIRQSDMLLAHNVTANDDIVALGKAKQSFMSGSKDIQKLVSTMEFKKGLAVLFDDRTRKMEMVRVRPRMSLHAGGDASALDVREKVNKDTKPVLKPSKKT